MTPNAGTDRRPSRLPGFFDLGLIGLAIGYLIFVGVGGVGAGLYSSADRVTDDGRVWLLFTSALDVVNTLAVVQWVLLATAVILVIYRLGPRIWWVVAIGGHIGAAIVSYTAIEIAIALGSQSANHTATQTDYGISIVLAATLGALAASVLPSRRADYARMDRADHAALWFALLGLVGMVAVSFGWYDIQHLIGYGIGFVVAGSVRSRPGWQVKFLR